MSQLDVQEEAVTEKLEAARRIAAAQFEQREEAQLGTSLGGEILRAVRVEMVGDSAAPPSVVQLGEMLEVAEDRFGAALDLREAGFQETSVGSRYLVDATQSILGGEQSPTLPQRELIITTAESRLEQDLDRREATLRASVAGAEVLDTMQLEGADEYGSVLTLVQRAQLVETAGRRLERREAEEEVRRREEVLRSVSLGAQYLSEAEQEGLGEGKRAAVLAARDALVTKAEQRLEADLSRRESDLVATSFGPALLREAFGERGDGDAGLSFAARDRGLEQVETRVGEALRVQEEALRSIPFGRQCLPEETQGRSGDAEGVTAPLAERESRVRVAEQRVGEELARLEKEHVAKAGHDLLVEAAGALGDGRTFSLGERWEVYERAQSRFEEEQRKLDREEAAVGEDPAGAEFLRNARHEVIGAADREVTLAERARIVKAAAALQAAAEAKREAAAKQRAEQERETRRWEEQRDAGVQALARQPGGEDLYHAHLADLDPKWDWQRSNSSSRQNIDAALAAAAADGTRRERLRVVLSDKVDAARYREELGKVAGQFKTPDLDRALAVAEQEREKRETRRWEEQRDAGIQALSRQPGGVDLYHAHLADLDPKWDRKRNDRSSREHIDAALAAAASDGTRRERLRVVLSDKVDAARYREELGKVAGQFKTPDLDRALAVAEQEREKRETRRWEEQRDAGIQALSRQPGGVDLYHAHLADLDPKWDRKRNDRSSREHIDAALAAAASDGTRRERLRVVLSDKVDAARYREELGKVAGQFKTSDLDRALAVVEQEREERETRQWEDQKAARVRREARHQMVSDTPGGDERLRAAGWEKARTDGMQDRVLATVELSLTADFNRREQQLRTDDEGKAFLRRGRVEVLEADREPETLAERGKVIERAEVLRQAAVAERKRVARLKRLFAVSGGDKVFFASLDARTATWRARETVPADIDFALDMAEQRIDRTKPATAEHEVVVNAEQTFSDAPSAAWRQAGDRFPKGSAHARVSQQLADRALAGALAAEREEPPASPALVQRLFTWLRAQVDKLLQRLGLVKRSVPLEADELMNAFVARGEALDQVRMHFADLDPQTAVPYVVMKAIDPQLLKAALLPGEAARWTKPLNDRYEVIRRNHPERFKKEIEPVWEAQRCSWVAPLEADELMNAFVARGEALDQVRMHFADLDPQTAVPYVVMKAIDPQLLKAALLPGEAARWTKPLNDRYEVIRRNHPERFKKEIEPVWEAQRGFWTAAGSQDLGPTSVTTPAPVTDPAGDEEQAGTPGVPGQDGTATPAPVTDPAGDEEQAGTPGVPGQHGTATPARPRITVARGGERSDRTDTRDRASVERSVP